MSLTTDPRVPLRSPDRFIGGEWVKPSSEATIDVIDSSTEQLSFRVPEAQAADKDFAIEAARRAFDRGPWPRMCTPSVPNICGRWPTSSKHAARTTVRCGHGSPVSRPRLRGPASPATRTRYGSTRIWLR